MPDRQWEGICWHNQWRNGSGCSVKCKPTQFRPHCYKIGTVTRNQNMTARTSHENDVFAKNGNTSWRMESKAAQIAIMIMLNVGYQDGNPGNGHQGNISHSDLGPHALYIAMTCRRKVFAIWPRTLHSVILQATSLMLCTAKGPALVYIDHVN